MVTRRKHVDEGAEGRPRVLMVTPNFPPDTGGVQTYSYELADQLHRYCAAFAVLAPTRSGTRAIDRELPYPVYRVPDPGDGFALSGVAPIAWIAARHYFDVVLAMHWTAAHAALLSPTGWPRRTVCMVHGKDIVLRVGRAFPPLGNLYDRVRRRVFRTAHAFAANSTFTARLLEAEGVPPARRRIVGGGANPTVFRRLDSEAFRSEHGLGDAKVLLSVARLVSRKGIDRVLAALPAIARRVPQARYLIVGEGPDRGRLEALARRHGVTERVIWFGDIQRDYLPVIYSAADVFVMPASSTIPDVEGFGLVFVEAAACGTPSVGSIAGGIPDAVAHGETGLLVDPDDAAALERAIVSLLIDRDRRRAMGERARATALRRNTWEAVADRLAPLLFDGWMGGG